MKTTYYAHFNDVGNPTVLIKMVGTMPYKYVNGRWVSDSRYIDIWWDVTAPYDEISEAEADRIISEYFS